MENQEVQLIEYKVKEILETLQGLNTKTAKDIIEQCSYNIGRVSEVVDVSKMKLRLSRLI